ncbi:hypothetical protein SKAU_G00259190 [Synaphobranchus kaupii]|uniref:Uncharacterized protein n=1 Tax=Synaphobranchus kaupii TaxID=118154 RepID=A0A9Q1F4D9_SYNKA|nr:hypothetical protein SKAU_G00259190 [Synaphobranchus kaupii]
MEGDGVLSEGQEHEWEICGEINGLYRPPDPGTIGGVSLLHLSTPPDCSSLGLRPRPPAPGDTGRSLHPS